MRMLMADPQFPDPTMQIFSRAGLDEEEDDDDNGSGGLDSVPAFDEAVARHIVRNNTMKVERNWELCLINLSLKVLFM
jgi:hypothetical protein